MRILSQRDKLCKDIKLGTCKSETIGSGGCAITCFAMLLGTTPYLVNLSLLNRNGYLSGCLVDFSKACKLIGLDYKGVAYKDPKEVCIAKVELYGHDHFVIWLGDGNIIDPWTGTKKKNNYKKIFSFRLFNNLKENQMKETISIERFRRLENRYKHISKLFNKFAESVRKAIKEVDDGVKDTPPF